MNSATQNRSWIPGTCGRTATTGLASAIIFVAAVFATALAQAQTFTTLATFNHIDGSYPTELILGTDGNFYGTTAYGGAISSCEVNTTNGCGTVFKMTPSGML